MLHLNAPLFLLKCLVSPKKALKFSVNAHYTNGFFKLISKFTLTKRASVASNNDNVYKFINTAKKTAVLGFL